MAQCEDPVAQSDFVEVARFHKRPGTFASDFHHAGVQIVICAKCFGASGFAIRKSDARLSIRFVRNVGGCQNQAVLCDHDTAATSAADLHGNHRRGDVRHELGQVSLDRLQILDGFRS